MSQAHGEGFRKSVVREYFESICVAVILAFFVRTFVVQAFKIPSGSMEPNLLIGDHLLVNKFVFAPALSGLERILLPIDPVRRGDILVFKYPRIRPAISSSASSACPATRLRCGTRRSTSTAPRSASRTRISSIRPMSPAPARQTWIPPGDLLRSFPPMMVPPDNYFMMGDNRDNSQDSRYWGFMPRDYVKGKALFVYFSFGEGGGTGQHPLVQTSAPDSLMAPRNKRRAITHRAGCAGHEPASSKRRSREGGEVAGARDVRVDLRRRHPRLFRPHLRRPGVQNPKWINGSRTCSSATICW
jgi:signal peptidase I